MTSGWTLTADPLTAAGALLAAVLCAAVGLRIAPPPPGVWRRAVIIASRLAAVGLIALLLLDPERRRGAAGDPVPLTVLLDVSGSVADADRTAAAALIERWGEDRPVTVRRFGDEDGTDPAAAVRAALGEPAVRRGGAILLLTDGRSTVGRAGRTSAVADAAAAAGVRLLIVAFGEPDPLGGVRTAGLTATRPVGPGEPVTVTARWAFADGVPKTPPPLAAALTDRETGARLAAGPVTVDGETATFTATLTPTEAGRRTVDLTLTAAGEPVPAGGGSLTLDVPGDPLRVLLIADRRRHEVRFLRDLIAREPTLTLLEEREAGATDEPPDVTITVGPPPEPAATPFPGGRIEVRTDPAPGPPAIRPTPVTAMPLGTRLGFFTADPPALFGPPPAAPPDPAAAVLATAGGEPLVTLTRAPDGVNVTVRSPQTWRWRAAETGDPHRRFWLAAVRLAAAGPDEAPAVLLDPPTVEAGGESIVTAVGSGGGAVRVEPLDVGPDAAVRTVPVSAGGTAVLSGLPPGRFAVSVVGTDGPAATLSVTPPPTEEEVTSQDRTDLRRAAERSGGRFLTLGEARRSSRFLPPAPPPPGTASVDRLAERWEPVVLLALLLGAEWTLRRRGGGV